MTEGRVTQHGGAGMNKTHDQVEKRQRIDSFDIMRRCSFSVEFGRSIPFERDGDRILLIQEKITLPVTTMENAAGS